MFFAVRIFQTRQTRETSHRWQVWTPLCTCVAHRTREECVSRGTVAQVSLPELLQPSLKDVHTGQWEVLRDIDKERTVRCYFMPEVQQIYAPYTQYVIEIVQCDMCTFETFVQKNYGTTARIWQTFRGLNV